MGNLVLLTFEANNRYSNQGTPAAYFDNTNCDFAAHFGPMNIIINLAFCTWRSNFLLPVYAKLMTYHTWQAVVWPTAVTPQMDVPRHVLVSLA